MAKITFTGGDDFGEKLAQLSHADARGMIKRAVKRGAAPVADAIKEAIRALVVTEEGYERHGSERHMLTSITKRQKEGLLESMGIASIREDKNGFINVKVGFDGYNTVKTKKFPQGQPNALIARAINSGTSFRKKTRFIDKAVKKTEAQSIKAMNESINADIREIFEK